jgi:hypothetical protein
MLVKVLGDCLLCDVSWGTIGPVRIVCGVI